MRLEVVSAVENPAHTCGQDRLAPPIELNFSRALIASNTGATVNSQVSQSIANGGGGIAGTPCTAGAKIPLKDLDIAVVGARIKF